MRRFGLENDGRWFTAFTESLAHRHALPVQAVTMLALAVLTGAAGRSVKIQPATAPAINLGLNLILAGATDDITRRLLSAFNQLADPLRDLQAELMERRDSRPPEAKAEYDRLLRQLHQLESSPFPDANHVAHVKARIRQHRQLSKAQLVVTNLRSGQLGSAVAMSPDESLLHVINDDVKFNQRLRQAHSRPNVADWDALRAAWLNEQFCQPGVTLTPCLSTVVMCRAETLQRFWRHTGLQEQGVTEMFQVVWIGDAEAGAETGAARPVSLDEGGGRRRWAGLIRELVDGRFEVDAPRIIRPTEEAKRIVAEYRQAFGVAAGDLGMLCRLAGAFCLAGGSIDPPGRFKGLLAIRLQRWLVVKAGVTRIPQSEAFAARPVVEAECDRMLQKIRDMAPISARDLFRRYDRQVAAQHRPVLEELLSRGLVRQDQEGNLVITQFSEARPLTALTALTDGLG